MLQFSFLRESHTALRINVGGRETVWESRKRFGYVNGAVKPQVQEVAEEVPPCVNEVESPAMLPAECERVSKGYFIGGVDDLRIMRVLVADAYLDVSGTMGVSFGLPNGLDNTLSYFCYDTHGFVYLNANRVGHIVGRPAPYTFRVLCEISSAGVVLLHHGYSPFLFVADKRILDAEGNVATVSNTVVYVPTREKMLAMYRLGEIQGYRKEVRE